VHADNPIALVDKVAERKGNTRLAQAYLKYHYSPEAQDIFARNYLRPSEPAALQRHAAEFPPLKVFQVEQAFGGWAHAQALHFAEGGIYDQIVSRSTK
jgi:sulfate transport system substrate-binding protein